MLCFNPDRFAVVGEEPMTRMAIPGMDYAEWGLVRDVSLDPDDLAYRMVSFSARDLGVAVKVKDPARFFKFLENWGWPLPKYPALQAWQRTAAKGLTWSHVRVYTYPEAAVMLDQCFAQGVTTYRKFGKTTAPDIAAQVTRDIATIREELEATYDSYESSQ